jgi:hypothetical protein
MSTPQHRWRAAAAGCLTAVAVSSCGSGPSAAPTAQAGVSPPAVSAQTQPLDATPAAALPDADEKACAAVEAIIGHITVDTARWSPSVRPFDRDIATRLATQTDSLNDQALAASLPLRRAVATTAAAFGDVSKAIMAKDRSALDRAIPASRTAYSGLKKFCKLDD